MSEQILIDALCKISSPQGILTPAEMWDIADKALKDFEAAQHRVQGDVCAACRYFASCPGEILAPDDWSCAKRTRA